MTKTWDPILSQPNLSLEAEVTARTPATALAHARPTEGAIDLRPTRHPHLPCPAATGPDPALTLVAIETHPAVAAPLITDKPTGTDVTAHHHPGVPEPIPALAVLLPCRSGPVATEVTGLATVPAAGRGQAQGWRAVTGREPPSPPQRAITTGPGPPGDRPPAQLWMRKRNSSEQ